MDYAEQRGLGLRNMSQLPNMGYPLPEFKMNAGALELTFSREKRFVTEAREIDNKLSEDNGV